jgi:Flp pilus assembly CpaF family ATPase
VSCDLNDDPDRRIVVIEDTAELDLFDGPPSNVESRGNNAESNGERAPCRCRTRLIRTAKSTRPADRR